MRAAIYTRISRDLRDGAGVERQLQDCRKLCNERGYEIVYEFSDNDISAYGRKKRPGYQALLAAARRGEFERIVAWHPDRLYRRISGLAELLDVAEKNDLLIDTINTAMDLSTPEGIFQASMLATVANYEVAHTIERQKAAHASRAAKGLFRGGRPPFGYKLGKEKGTLEIDPEQAAALRFGAQTLLSGGSIRQIALEWYRRGVVKRTSNTVHYTSAKVATRLLNPRIAGFERHHDNLYKAQWEPILDEATWRAVCEILRDDSRRTNKHGHKRLYLGSGVFRCGCCGSKVSTLKRGNNPDGRSYVCNQCFGISRKIKEVDAVVEAVVLKYLDQETNRLQILRKDSGDAETYKDLTTQRRALEGRKNDLARLFSRGEIDANQLAAGSAVIDRDLKQLEVSISRVSSKSALNTLVLSGDSLRDTWGRLSIDQKVSVINELFEVRILHTTRRGGRMDPAKELEFVWRL